jgi:hypothetical protein
MIVSRFLTRVDWQELHNRLAPQQVLRVVLLERAALFLQRLGMVLELKSGDFRPAQRAARLAYELEWP